MKLGEQYKGSRDGGKRVADTVGAGSEDFGKDGCKENGGWEKGAKGLRTGGQKSLVELWSATKPGKMQPQEKDMGTREPLPEAVFSSTETRGGDYGTLLGKPTVYTSPNFLFLKMSHKAQRLLMQQIRTLSYTAGNMTRPRHRSRSRSLLDYAFIPTA